MISFNVLASLQSINSLKKKGTAKRTPLLEICKKQFEKKCARLFYGRSDCDVITLLDFVERVSDRSNK